MAPRKNQSTKAVVVAAAAVSSSNGNGKDNSPGTSNARASVCARARGSGGGGGGDDVPALSSAFSPVPVAPAPGPASSSSSSASASSSAAQSPVPALIASSSCSYSAAAGTGNRAGTSRGARWMSAPEQARLKYVHVRAAASYIGVLKSPFFPQDGAAYLSHLASVKARELEKMKAKLEAAKLLSSLSKDAAKAKSRSKGSSKSSGSPGGSGSSSSSLGARLPVVGVSGGLASCWIPLYHGGDSSLSLLSVEHDHDNDNAKVEGGVMKKNDHQGGGKGKGKAVSASAAASSKEEAAAAAAAGTESTSSSSSSSSASGDDRAGGNKGSPRDNLSSDNRVNNSVDNLPRPLPASSSSPSSGAFAAAAAGTFNTTTTTTNTSDTPFDTTSASSANRGSTIRGGFALPPAPSSPAPPAPSSPAPPAPRLAPLLKGKTNLTEDFFSVVLAKPNPFNGFWTVKCPDSDTSPGPEAVPFPTAAEYTHEASRPSIRSQVSPGQPSLSSSDAGGGSSNVRVDKRKDKKMKQQKQKGEKKKKGKSKHGKLPLESIAVLPVSGVRGPPSRSWPLPRWQGYIRNGDAGHQNQHIKYMDEGYVRHLWSEKLEPHQQFARLRKAGLVDAADAHGAGQMMREPMVESGIEGLITPPTDRTHELELMVGAAAEAQFDCSRIHSRQVVSAAPDLAFTYSGLAPSVVAEPAHHHSGLASSVADEPARTSTPTVVDAIIAPLSRVEASGRAPAPTVVAAPITPFSSSFSATATPFVPRSLAPDAPEFVPSSSSGERSERDSLSATADEFVPPSSVVVAPAAVVTQQHQSLLSLSSDPLSLVDLSSSSVAQSEQPQQQQQQLTREELLSSLDPGRVNSWTDYRRDHPRAARPVRPSSHLGHQRNRHQQVSVPRCYSFPAPASPPRDVSLASPGSPPRYDPQPSAEEQKTPLAPAPFDPSRPDFEENFPPLGQTGSVKLSKPSKQQQQEPKASNDHDHDHDEEEEDIYAASPVLVSASAAAADVVGGDGTGNNTAGETSETRDTIECAVSCEVDGSGEGAGTTSVGPAGPGPDVGPAPGAFPGGLPSTPFSAAPGAAPLPDPGLPGLPVGMSTGAPFHLAGTPYVHLYPDFVPGFELGMGMAMLHPAPGQYGLPNSMPPAPYPHGYGYQQPLPHPQHAQQPGHSQPLPRGERRVHFADFNTVIHLPASPGSGGIMLESVPQGRPDDATDGYCAGSGSASGPGFESLPLAAASGFDSHNTPAFDQAADTEPLPAPYNSFRSSSLGRFEGTWLESSAFAGLAASFASAASAAFAFSAAPAFPAAAAAQASPQQQQPGPPYFNPGHHHAPPAAPNPDFLPPHPRSAPPPFREPLETVNVLDLVEDLREAGVVEREAEAWQLRAPVGERTWDLHSGEEEVLGLGDEGEVREIRLEEVPVVVRELVEEIDEFDD
ncbi:hypothetical protein QBC32DRAFT_398117 [Pseudoneurospora amorphoporcata]|uniref:Uncharacterized protein n=1 Tax=Pseudoneurospora amorphoporcata TaxID=241081 RepID=A0AAN6NW79_9PEZI|nr:hypothetical protein QBC32DRAFT_398117 [Pseudoneurospora amorphoporcata]